MGILISGYGSSNNSLILGIDFKLIFSTLPNFSPLILGEIPLILGEVPLLLREVPLKFGDHPLVLVEPPLVLGEPIIRILLLVFKKAY